MRTIFFESNQIAIRCKCSVDEPIFDTVCQIFGIKNSNFAGIAHCNFVFAIDLFIARRQESQSNHCAQDTEPMFKELFVAVRHYYRRYFWMIKRCPIWIELDLKWFHVLIWVTVTPWILATSLRVCPRLTTWMLLYVLLFLTGAW